MPRIALIHALKHSLPPIEAAFARLWPQARLCNLLDDSLSADLAAAGCITEAMTGRFLDLARYSVRAGADATSSLARPSAPASRPVCASWRRCRCSASSRRCARQRGQCTLGQTGHHLAGQQADAARALVRVLTTPDCAVLQLRRLFETEAY
jgi:hypothetical protein